MTTVYLTITELNQRVSRLLERQIPLLWVQGEISNLTRATSGHWYFSLKDDKAQVRAVMFRQKNNLLSWQPREGDAVQAQVLAGLYPARGEFQLTVENLRRAGLGTLFEQFLKLKEKLAALDWFDSRHKKPLPYFVKTIGIVTSPQAAALRDVLQTLKRRAPHIKAILYPTLVQGDLAAAQIVKAISKANQNKKLDALLLVRGGGSLEDLWSFNEQIVAQAIKESRLLIVSGVGHETDTTIADFVADVRAETPTAAAEQISHPSADEWLKQLMQKKHDLKRALMLTLNAQEQRLERLSLQLLTPTQRLNQQVQYIDRQWARLCSGVKRIKQLNEQHLNQSAQHLKVPTTTSYLEIIQKTHTRLDLLSKRYLIKQQQRCGHAAQQLLLLNPEHVLSRGYAYIRAQDGSIVYQTKQLQVGDGVTLYFSDGHAVSTIDYLEC